MSSPKVFIRTCQECGNQQADIDPDRGISQTLWNAYRDRKCRKCKSQGLDYGKLNSEMTDVKDDPEDD